MKGKKIFLKGNHDYWWSTLNKMRNFLEDNNFKDVIDKMFGFDSYNNDFFSLNELNLLYEKDEKYENNLIN